MIPALCQVFSESSARDYGRQSGDWNASPLHKWSCGHAMPADAAVFCDAAGRSAPCPSRKRHPGWRSSISGAGKARSGKVDGREQVCRSFPRGVRRPSGVSRLPGRTARPPMGHSLGNQTQKIRSRLRNFGRLTDRWSALICCRRARFSAIKAVRSAKSLRRSARTIRITPIHALLSHVNGRIVPRSGFREKERNFFARKADGVFRRQNEGIIGLPKQGRGRSLAR